MRTIPFRPAHLSAFNPGAEERTELAQFGPGILRALTQGRGPAHSLIDGNGRVLGCLGMLVVGREGVLWAVLSDEARAQPFGLHRAAKRQLESEMHLGTVDRVLTVVRDGHDAGQRWIARLGFTYDGDILMKDTRYRRYVRWQ